MAYPLVELVFASHDGGDAENFQQSVRATAPTLATTPGDENVVASIRGGDEHAFTALVHDLAPVLHVYAYRYAQSSDVARDVVQDVFTRLWERRATWTVKGTVRQYLFIATRLRALELLRRGRIEERHALSVGETDSLTPPVDSELERIDRFVAVARAVQELPPRQREIVRLRWIEGLTNAAAAARLGISVKGIEIQLTRALHTLRGRLTK